MLNMPASPTLIVDTAYLYFRAYYGVSASLVDDSGRPVNAVYGLLEMLTRLIGAYSPTVLFCAWDDDWRPAWRVELTDEHGSTLRVDGPMPGLWAIGSAAASVTGAYDPAPGVALAEAMVAGRAVASAVAGLSR